jgi:hypothetical protein
MFVKNIRNWSKNFSFLHSSISLYSSKERDSHRLGTPNSRNLENERLLNFSKQHEYHKYSNRLSASVLSWKIVLFFDIDFRILETFEDDCFFKL